VCDFFFFVKVLFKITCAYASFRGNSRTVLIICASSSSSCLGETLGTLGFGMRAKTIKNVVRENKEYSVEELKMRCYC
jgi:kinesin family protein 5